MQTVRRVVALLPFLVISVAVPAEEAAPIERVVLPSEILSEDRPLNIVLPDGYSDEKAYPVVFALDGDDRFISDFAARMHSAQPELIVVGVVNVDRSRDMFPDPLPNRPDRGGGGRLFLQFLTSELVPFVEATYSTNGYRVLSGQSNSGFFVLWAMNTSPEDFDAYLASSPMIGWDWELIRKGSTALFESNPGLDKALYLNRGETDYDRTTDFLPKYVNLLEMTAPDSFRWKQEVVAGGEHVPESSHGDGIAFIFKTR